MVILNQRGGDGIPRCASGHVCVCVTRGARLTRVCPECLRSAISAVKQREMTVNDYLAKLEVDKTPPKVTQGEASAAEELYRAARELYDEPSVSACRKVVRDAAKASGVTSSEAMKWTLKELANKGLSKLREAVQAA